MNLLVVTHYYETHGGGVEIVAGHLARHWADHGCRVRWVASDCDQSPTQASVVAAPMSSFNLLETRAGIPYPLWSPGALGRLWREIGWADVVILHDTLYFGNAAASVMAKQRRKPIVAILHVGAVAYTNVIPRTLMKVANASVGRVVIRSAAKLVSVSELTRDYYANRGIARESIELIHNGVDTEVFRPNLNENRMALRRAVGIENRPLWVFVGRFVEKKGLDIVRRLAEARPEHHWLVVGRGPIDPENWRLGNVVVRRNLGAAELAPIYCAADALVLPSVGEGMPLVIQEAMACGTPVLTGEDTAAADPRATCMIVAESVDFREPEATTARWLSVLDGIAAGHLSIPRAPLAKFARANWSWHKSAARYLEIFQAVLR